MTPPTGPLSDREVVVLHLLALGYSNKQIAARLVLSVKTVETYKARAYEKLGFYSRVDLMRHAIAAGWLLSADPPVSPPVASEAAPPSGYPHPPHRRKADPTDTRDE